MLLLFGQCDTTLSVTNYRHLYFIKSSYVGVKAGNHRISHVVEGNLRTVGRTLQLPNVVRVVFHKTGKGTVVGHPPILRLIGRQE